MVELSFAARAICVAVMPAAPAPSMKARVATAMVLDAPVPEPATLTPAAPPPWSEAETAATSALIVWFEVAVRLSAPSELRLDLLIEAWTSLPEPMVFEAAPTPTETPTPAAPPPPAAAAAATIRAWMSAVASAFTVEAPPPTVSTLSATNAFVRRVMTFDAPAPPPLTETPAAPPPPTETAAAAEIARIRASLRALTETPPLRVVSPASTLAIEAWIPPAMLLMASAKPIATPTPAAPPPAPESEDAPVTAMICAVFAAVTVTLPALMPSEPVPSPSIVAEVTTPMAFAVTEPAPLTDTPAAPPPWMAAEAATTVAEIFWLAVA